MTKVSTFEALQSSGMKRFLFWIVTVLGVPALLLICAEAGLRLADYGSRTDFFIPVEGQRAYATNPNFARQFFPPALARLPLPIRVAFDKPDDVTRIVVLGGSAAMGEPEPTFSFSRILDVMLSRQYPDRKFEVINTGMATINSHVVRLIAEECHKIEPDIVLIYMGNNEVVGPFGAGTVFGSHSPSLTLIRLGIRLRSYRLGQLIEEILRWVGGTTQFVPEGQGMAMFRDQYVQSDDDRLQKVYTHFERNLTDIVETLRRDGAEVIVSTVGANLVDHSPFASVFGHGLGKADPQTWGTMFVNGISYAEQGDLVRAIRMLEGANRIDSTHAELHYRLGHLYHDQGNQSASRAHLIRARDFDTLRFRVDSKLNQIIRDAGDRLRVRSVDTAKLLGDQDRSGLGVPGADLFHEHVHLTFRGNYVVAAGMADAISELLGMSDVSVSTIEQCADDLALTPLDRYRLYASVAGLMRRAPFTNQYDYLEKRKLVNQRANALRAKGTSGAAIEHSLQTYRQALDRRPDDLALHQNYAQILQETGALVEAASEWKRLLERIPNTPAWRLALGTTLSDQGAHQAALHEYRALQESMPGLVLPHIQIGYELVSAGRIGEAIHVLQEALRINPGSIVARLNVIALLEDVELSEAADAALDEGLAQVRDRGDQHAEADLLVGRSELLVRREKWAEAIPVLEEALTLYQATRNVASEARTRMGIARVHKAKGDSGAAMRWVDEGVAFCRSFALYEAEAQFVLERALMAMEKGDLEEARSEIGMADGLYRSLSDRHPAIGKLERLLEAIP